MMPADIPTNSLERQIAQWRDYMHRRVAIHTVAIHTVDVAMLEARLREQLDSLVASGLDVDEAFLVAVKRMGTMDQLSRQFAREQSGRLWKQLVVASSDPLSGINPAQDAKVAWGLAVAAALLVKLPVLFGLELDSHAGFYVRNAGFFVLPLLAIYFAWKRKLDVNTVSKLGLAFVVAAVFANSYPFVTGGSTEVLATLHMPIVLWLLVGIAYAGGRWSEVAGRMDFVRFSGELFIYFVLIGLGGGVLIGFMLMIFAAIGIDAEPYFETWLLPCGAAGAVLVAAWLVEAKQSVIENMAPVLTRLFTPLFTAVLLVFLATVLFSGRGLTFERDLMIAFDLLLALVLGLLLYSISAREAQAAPGWFDRVMVLLVLSALVADAVALWTIAGRINEFGFSPNRVAVLGENLLLLANLAWSAVLYIRFLLGRGNFAALERWQTNYLPVYAIWAAVVVIVFPPLFNYV